MIRKLLHRIKYFFTGKPKWGRESEHPIEFTFEFNGKEYYSYTNTFNIPYQRALVAMSFYEEFNMRITREFLEAWIIACKVEFERPTIRILEISKLFNMIESRLDWVVEAETVYKIASVVFFTKEESPYKYDPIFNAKKIKEWKKTSGVYDFFLRLPIQELVPFLNQSPEITKSYLQSAIAKTLEDWVTIQAVLSQDPSKSELTKDTQSVIVDLQELYLNI